MMNPQSCLAALVLTMAGFKAQRWGYCYYFEIGNRWGGCEIGLFFLKDKTSDTHIKNHELGHSIQNCYFGFAIPFVICVPSAIRYWYRKLKHRADGKPYDSVWFEKQATRIGSEFMEHYTKAY